MRVCQITEILEKYAPPELASSYDNVGLILGDKEKEVTTVLLTLDVDLEVAKEAKALGAELIISHHPMLFHPMKSITTDTPEGNCILYLAENKIAVFSAHTNLDSAPGGLNDLAAQFLNLENTMPLDTEEGAGIGRIGALPTAMSLERLAAEIRSLYRLPFIRFVGDGKKVIRKVALCTGSGGDLITQAKAKGADAYITGDIKYSVAREAEASGLAMVELGHYESEYIAVDLLEKIITHYGNAPVVLHKSRANKNVFRTL